MDILPQCFRVPLPPTPSRGAQRDGSSREISGCLWTVPGGA
ncbi:hypothetical protein E2C01_044111 [Portunus trituberculatus]|uniref:Uncharacterized protein n=1 Tax=Portunus trituberculatus TaxID=210409 RepID=A0A5B7FXY7_PORTR|nr:hypothetical protein [Portunus trituberculatus]